MGITTTVPVEVIFASGLRPVDLNNLFMSEADPRSLVEEAEVMGYPRNLCSWIKGLYAACLDKDISRVVGVVRGDCSNTEGLVESLQVRGVDVYPFQYPYRPDLKEVGTSINNMMDHFGPGEGEVAGVLPKIEEARKLAWDLDEMCWKEGKVSGREDHLALISTSDFLSDVYEYISWARDLKARAAERESSGGIRIGYVGIPPIVPEIYDHLAAHGARMVYNEVQHQFSLPYPDAGWKERYALYTYPYDVFGRIDFIKKEIRKRGIEGLVHYVQSFCHHQIDDVLLRQETDLPVLTLEQDSPGALDERTKIRIESFLDVLM